MGAEGDWWRAQKGEVHASLFPYVEQVERKQAGLFDRFVKLACLYDPYSPLSDGVRERERDQRLLDGVMQENVIASNCDAIAGSISATEVNAKFTPTGESWKVHRQARQLDWYAEELSDFLDIDRLTEQEFHAGSLKGTALVKFWNDGFGQIRAEGTPVDEIIVDDAKYRGREPREMAQRMLVGRDVLLAEYPEKKKEIMDAQTTGRAWKRWAGYRPIPRDMLVVVEAWRLPIGPKDHKNHQPGRRVLCIEGADLVDEVWSRPRFPFAVFRWTRRPESFYGIGGGERIIGHQRKLNRRNFQIDRQIDQNVFPITYTSMVDATIAVKTTNRAGAIVPYKAATPPVTRWNPGVSPEQYQDRETTKASSFEEFGQSRMAVTAMKPAGIDSAVGLREYRDQTTQRFAHQEKGYERFKLDAVMLALDCAQELGDKAPTFQIKGALGRKRIELPKIDLELARLWIQPSSPIADTPAGRRQLAAEMAQQGLISRDSALKMSMPNSDLDIEAEMSLYVEARLSLEAIIEEIEDGEQLVPEPYQNLEMAVWLCTAAYQRDQRIGAPEEVLEGLRQYIVACDYLIEQAELAAQAAAAPPANDQVADAAVDQPMLPPGLPPMVAQPPPAPMGAEMAA